MATTVITQIHDDLDNSDAATTREFAFDGVAYEIDLVDKNYEKMRAALEPFISAARRVRSGATARPAQRGLSLASRKGYTTQEVRAWAKRQGMEITERGRIPNAIVEQYDAARTAPAAKAAAKKAPAKKAAPRKAPAGKTTDA